MSVSEKPVSIESLEGYSICLGGLATGLSELLQKQLLGLGAHVTEAPHLGLLPDMLSKLPPKDVVIVREFPQLQPPEDIDAFVDTLELKTRVIILSEGIPLPILRTEKPYGLVLKASTPLQTLVNAITLRPPKSKSHN